MTPNTIYPWQQKNWQQLTDTVQKNRLPHALLFVGENGSGKRQFAAAFAAALLCADFPTLGKRCENCHACHLFNAGSHPDLMQIESEPGHAIKIDQIRETTDFVNQTALLNGWRIIIIYPATAMNNNAANALLKTLEEPTPNTLLILISDLSLRLPATVLSRCQKIVFSNPALENENLKNIPFRQDFYQALDQLSEGKIDPIELAEQWHEKDSEAILELLFYWVADLLRLKTICDSAILTNQDMQSVLLKISQKLSMASLLRYSDHLQKITSYRREGLNLNQRLLLEELLIKWVQHVAS